MKKTLKIDVDVSAYTSIEILKESRVLDEISKKVNGVLERNGQKARVISIIKASKNAVSLLLLEKRETVPTFLSVYLPMNAAQQAGLLPPQSQPFYGFGGQQAGTPFFDPNNPPFQEQPGAFAPYQQPSFYDPATAAAFTAPYGYMPAAY